MKIYILIIYCKKDKQVLTLKLLNKEKIKPKDILIQLLKLKETFKEEIYYFSFSFYLYDSKTHRNQFENYDKDLVLNYFRLSFGCRSYANESITKYINENLNFIDKENLGTFENATWFSISKNRFEEKNSSFSMYDRFSGSVIDDYAYFLNLDIAQEILNKDNLFDLLTLYFKFKGLNDMSEIKLFKTLFFGNISNKDFYPYLEELVNENKIIIEKSSTGVIKRININNNYSKNNEILNIVNELKHDGVLKLISNPDSFIKYDNADLEIYDLKFYKNLKIVFNYKNNNLDLKIYHNDLGYVNLLLKSFEETQVIDKIKNDIIQNLLPKIETKLNKTISNKNELVFSGDSFELKNIVFN